jgi:glycosyltransferase involved in cell wall biosynthesis
MTRVALAGGTTVATAFSRVNHAWFRGLTDAGYVMTSDEGSADVLIHHDYRQHFATCPVAPGRTRVAVRTWDFGPFPRAWADRIGRDFDRLWVPSRWIREQAIEGGVAPERTAVVPNGFDPRVFRPQGPAADLGPRFHFLFVGAAVRRKGVDILLRAYGEAFGPRDPVCLILKGHAGDLFYRGQHLSEAIHEFARDPRRPALRYIDDHLPDDDLAALFRAADVGVFPYRAEGFAMPIVEAMACGLPCVVPRFGACLDYCTAENAFFVEARRIRLPVCEEFVFNSFGFKEHVDAVDFCEVPVSALAEALRAAYETGAGERRARGERAARAAHARWTWAESVARIRQLLEELGWAA